MCRSIGASAWASPRWTRKRPPTEAALLCLEAETNLARGKGWRRDGAVSKAREYIDFWIENSIHAVEEFRTPGASQDVAELVQRCIAAAKGQGISESDLQAEIGDVAAYIRGKLKTANKAEIDRRQPND